MSATRKGSLRQRWKQRQRAEEYAASDKGIPVPGTGVSHFHRRPSGSNKSGALRHLNLEWGHKARKWEDRQRNMNNTARRQAIQDQEDSA